MAEIDLYITTLNVCTVPFELCKKICTHTFRTCKNYCPFSYFKNDLYDLYEYVSKEMSKSNLPF